MDLRNLFKRKEKGQSLVEFAMVLPVLLLLIMGIIDFGMAFHSVVTVNTAAREGARQGIVLANDQGPTDSSTVVRAARRVTGTLLDEENRLNIFIGEDVAYEAGVGEVSPAFGLPTTGNEMTILVAYDYNFITPLRVFLGSNSLTLRGQITMVRE